jgi:hypothetical protein
MTRHVLPEGPESITDAPEGPWPSRPGAIELAAALLIVGGAISVVAAVIAIPSLPPGIEPFFALTIALDIGAILVGLLVRLGRAWILAVNYAAVLGFLDLMGSGASPLALMLGLADIVVVIVLLVHKPWFDALRQRRSAHDRTSAQPLTPPTARPPTR